MPRFNPPPNWPPPPPGWTPPPDWQPDPSLPPPPEEWQLWVDDESRDTARTWGIRGALGALWLVFLISGIASAGFSGFLVGLGLPLCVIGLVVGIRGGARWPVLVGRNAAWITAVVGLLAVMVGGAVGGSATPASTQATSTPAPTTSAPSPSPSPSASPTPTPAHQVRIVAGAAMPDPTITTGSAIPDLATTTVCAPNWTAFHNTVDNATADSVYAAYGIPSDQRARYELDHLIPVELGGDASLANLWPDPISAPVANGGAVAKDRLESHLRDLVCAGVVDLHTAQHAIATNWTAASSRYTPVQVPPPAPAPPPVHTQPAPTHAAPPPPTQAAPPPPADPVGATALCRDGTFSYSQHRRGTCSHHGGVLRWINRPPS